MAFTAIPLDGSVTPIPMSAVVPFGTNTPIAIEGGPTNTNSGNSVAPVSSYIKDGNSLVEGVTTDAAVTGDTSGTISGKLRGLNKILNLVWDNVNNLLQVNMKQVGGTAADTNSGNKSGGTLRVVLATDQPVLTNAQPVASQVNAVGGSIPYHNLSAASTNSTNVKGAACKLYSVSFSNTNAAIRYVKLYDKATAPTIGTDTPKHTFEIPGNALVAQTYPEGVQLALGFGWGTTTGVADTDTGAVGANDLVDDFRLSS